MNDTDVMSAPANLLRRPILITGGAGFIGSNLADRFAGEGYDVLIYDALTRSGVERNLAWLKQRHPAKISVIVDDVRNSSSLTAAVSQAQAVFHMAAQVAVTTSLEDPRHDFDVNVAGTLNLLEALRLNSKSVPLIFASTNKVYGDLSDIALKRTNDSYVPCDHEVHVKGIDESRPLDFHTPYGCSKGAADQYVLDYARSFGVPACVLRMSCVYGPRQMGTEDQGWVAHFLIKALRGEPISIYGDGYQVRDILDVSDAVEAYVRAWKRIGSLRGQVFNLGGGPVNAVSLNKLLSYIENLLGRSIEAMHFEWRAGDQHYYVSDIRRAVKALELQPPRPWREGIADLAHWLSKEGIGSSLQDAPLQPEKLMS